MQFVLNNWYLFLALIVVLAMLIAPVAMQLMYGIKTLSPAQCVLLVNRESAIVIDISESSEYKAGHIPNAINVPLSSFNQTPMEKYKDRPIIVVERNNNRALKAATMLRRRNFASVSLMTGGLQAWEKENLPLEKAK